MQNACEKNAVHQVDQKNQPAKTVKSDYDLSHVLWAVQPVITLVCLLTFFAHSDKTFLFR